MIVRSEAGCGKPLLLIHGNGCTARIWDNIVPELSKTNRVITYDRRSFGRSAEPLMSTKQYHETHANDAAELLKSIKAHPATVVGRSCGSLTALHLAIKYPELVSELVLAETPLHAKRHPTYDMRFVFLILSIQRFFGNKRAAARTFLKWATHYSSGGCAFDAMLSDKSREHMLEMADQILVEIDAGMGEEISDSQIQSIRVPVTCVVGSLTTKAIFVATNRIATLLPHARIVTIEGAGHMLHIDQPEAFVRAILKSEGKRR